LISAASFVFIFNLAFFGHLTAQQIVLIVAFALLLNATGYTIFNVPYLAMPAEMTNNYIERTKLISFRAGAVALGGIVATAIGPTIISAYGGGIEGFSVMSFVLGGVILAGGFVCFAGTARAPALVHSSLAGTGFREQLRTAVGNRPFLLLLGVKVCHLTGLAIYLSTMPFFFNVILEKPLSHMGLYFLTQSVFILISQFAWVPFTERWGKNAAYYLAVFFYVGALFSWLLAGANEPTALVLLRAVFTCLGAGGVLLIGQSLLPDTMQYDYQRTGIRREGVFAGVYTTVEKLSFALGPALMGVLLGAAGYVAGGTAAVEQSEASRWVIYAGVSIFPALGIASAGLVMTRYKLDEKMLREGQRGSD
jgi:GPH family glycoside/pentoside/hexuronide:cation symporter